MSDRSVGADVFLPFPIEFLIWDTPRSHQSANTRAKERWRRQVHEIAASHARMLGDLHYIDERPLALTLLYFPPAPMDGDIDNIVKLIADGMVSVFYPDDRVLERIVVQKFEPGVPAVFRTPTATLEQAASTRTRPVLYIRLDDDLTWREAA